MNFQNNRYTLKLADENDNDGIVSVFESGYFSGGLSVKYLRNPDPLFSFSADGDYHKIMVIRDNKYDKVVAVGGAVIRDEYVNGEIRKCGYLTGLKIHSDYQKKIRFIAKAYQFLYENISDCDYFYTTILDDNKNAIALLEKGHKNMPKYHYLGHYTTYCFHGGKNILELEKNNLTGFEDIVNTYFRRLSFTPVNYNYVGFGDKNFYCVRKGQEIIACCFLGNQQATKQYYMCSYGSIYKILSNMPTHILGYPSFPKPDSNINFGVISYLYVKNNNKRLCSDFLRSVAKQSDFSLLIWGGFENNPLCKAMNAMRTVKYGSRLYSVVWDSNPFNIENGEIIGVEAALL
ncbi:MAG: hypothetical protein GX286_03075 [Clostridiales bacterium]|jgi:hypothetical protein|nr:hypothetical protein [Clostridiales bacterium]